MRALNRHDGFMNGLTPDWIKAIEDTFRPDVKAAAPVLVKAGAERLATRPTTPAATTYPAGGGVATTPAPDATSPGYIARVGEWVKENPTTALTLAATLALILVKMRK